MENPNTIKYWAEDDRPREKLMLKGISALSDAELIAILIGSGSTVETAVDLAKRILKQSQDNLAELSRLSVKDLKKFRGIGEAKAISIIAALEIGNRRRGIEANKKKQITSSRDAFEILKPLLSEVHYEQFWILLMNKANMVLGKYPISIGGTSGTVADPGKIFKKAIEENASGIILCHNHPSGNVKPSEADIKLTKKMKEGGALLDISIHDHIIIGDDKYFSLADEGMM
ncbi:MAG: DNA repair protein RadC [Bacteroidetes bacterium]|nr:DNA repair protein RadC [Bacteroidota bacterium]